MKKNTLYLITGNNSGHGYTEGNTLVELKEGGITHGEAIEVTAGPDDDLNFMVSPEDVEEIGEI